MVIRDFKKEDLEAVEQIFSLYWTDPEFLRELSQKLKIYIERTPEFMKENYRFFVAEENNEIVGIAGMRSAPPHMKIFAKTENPVEFYIIAAKQKGKKIGAALREKRIAEAKKFGFTEVVFYSPNSHSDSWAFHDTSDFERVGETIAPDGEPGQIWRKIL